jgi:hypothetical protein
MAAATVRMSYWSGASPTSASAETGIVFSRSEAQAPAAGTAPIPIPTSTGTNYSWIMQLGLEVTSTGTTSINNRTIKYASSETAHTRVWFADQATYRRAVSGNKPTDSGTGSVATPTPAGSGAPGSYTALTTSAQVWDNTTVATSSAALNGDYVELVFGVDNSYTSGGGQVTLPNLTITYDEF